jgi:hypothetical protein
MFYIQLKESHRELLNGALCVAECGPWPSIFNSAHAVRPEAQRINLSLRELVTVHCKQIALETRCKPQWRLRTLNFIGCCGYVPCRLLEPQFHITPCTRKCAKTITKGAVKSLAL